MILQRLKFIGLLCAEGVWGRWLAGAWSLYGLFAAARDEFASSDQQAALKVLRLVPKMPWMAWGIVASIIVALWVFEASYAVVSKRANQKADADHNLPAPVAQAMAEAQMDKQHLLERLAILSALVRQYSRIVESMDTFAGLTGRNTDHEHREVAQLVIGSMRDFVVPLPDTPDTSITLRLGINRFRILYGGQMRRPPSLTFHGLPNGVHPELSEESQFGCVVQFWPKTVPVETFTMTADAEL